MERELLKKTLHKLNQSQNNKHSFMEIKKEFSNKLNARKEVFKENNQEKKQLLELAAINRYVDKVRMITEHRQVREE